MKLCTGLLACAFFVTSMAHAEYSTNPPFSAGDAERPAAYPSQKLEFTEGKPHDFNFTYQNLHFDYTDGATPEPAFLKDYPVLKITGENGRMLYGPKALKGGAPLGFSPLWKFTAPGESEPTYMVWSGSGGCGLAGDIATIYFISHAKSDPTVFGIHTYAFEPKDLVKLKDGTLGVYVTRVILTNETDDHHYHSYMVYDLLRFDGKAEPGYPRWRNYNNRRHYKPATHLTPETEVKLWEQELKNFPLKLLQDSA